MRSRASLAATLAIALAGAAALLAPAGALAATSDDVVALTEGDPWLQTCAINAADDTCTGPTSRIHVWLAVITPPAGPLDTLRTDATEFIGTALDAESHDWMVALHSLACTDSKGVLAFVDAVAALQKAPSSIGPQVVGDCTMNGLFAQDANGRYFHRIHSKVNPPPSAPPTAKPTLAPTAKPTAPPTTAPTASPAPSGPVSPASPGASGDASPGASESASPSTPASIPAGSTPGPSASVAAGPVAGPGPTPSPSTSAPPPPTFSQSVESLTDINLDAAAVGGSALLALLLLLFMAFPAELFNNTVENNYDEISGWFRRGRLGRAFGWVADRARVGVLGFVALTALISSFVDPSFGPNLASFAEFLGFLAGLIVVLASFKLPPMLAHRRKTGELGRLRPLPWALVISALFVLVSRIGNLQPGYLYGIVLGAIFTRDVSPKEEGRETLFGSVWTLAAAVGGWIGLEWLRGLGLPEDDFFQIFASTAFAAILVSGMEATAFGLMPLRFMPGHALYKYSRLAWALLFGLSVFAFIHILIAPTSGYLSDLSPAAFFAAAGVFAVFGAVTLGTWGYFRFRPKPVEAEA